MDFILHVMAALPKHVENIEKQIRNDPENKRGHGEKETLNASKSLKENLDLETVKREKSQWRHGEKIIFPMLEIIPSDTSV